MSGEYWLIGLIVVGCFAMILRGMNGNATHLLTAVVSYLFGARRPKK